MITLRQRCLAIDGLVLDVDGVLTAGGICYASHGDYSEIKTFHVRDGSGLKLWHQAGKRSAIITGRSSNIVDVRAAELGVHRVIQGAADKRLALRRLMEEWRLDPSAIAYVGDDVPDVEAMTLAGLAAAPADACSEARAAAHYIAPSPGGRGAVRAVVELVLRCQGHWPVQGG
jgi:3-deoxy-D-manno-octulosonate 8-phosphate phosphatase (KDO 8-P phosphatase)